MSHILNNDVIHEIFFYLTTEDLIHLQTVSQQFKQTVDYIFSCSKRLDIGKVKKWCSDRSHSSVKNFFICTIVEPRTIPHFTMTYRTIRTLIAFADKCSKIEMIGFKNCFVGLDTIKVLSKRFPRLRCMALESCMVPQNFPIEFPYLTSVRHFCVDVVYDYQMFALQNNIFIRRMSGLERLKTIALTIFELKETLQCMPSTINWLSVNVSDDKTLIFLNESIDFFSNRSIYNLKYLYIEDFFLTNSLLISVVENLNLIGFGFSCRRLEWRSITSMCESLKNLRHLRIFWTTFLEWPEDSATEPLISVTILEIHDLFAKLQTFEHFLYLFPNTKLLRYTQMHMECPISGLFCKTCLNQCFNRIFSQMGNLWKLIIRADDIQQTLIDRLSDGPNLKQLDIYRSKAELFEVDVWLIKQIVIAFVELSSKSKTTLFKIRLPKGTKVSVDLSEIKNLFVSAKLEASIREYD